MVVVVVVATVVVVVVVVDRLTVFILDSWADDRHGNPPPR